MKRLILLAASLLSLSAATAFGADDMAAFERKVAKFAPESEAGSKSLCVCQDGSYVHGRAGRLVQERVHVSSGGVVQFEPVLFAQEVRVHCRVPRFLNGTEFEQTDCETFVVLAK